CVRLHGTHGERQYRAPSLRVTYAADPLPAAAMSPPVRIRKGASPDIRATSWHEATHAPAHRDYFTRVRTGRAPAWRTREASGRVDIEARMIGCRHAPRADARSGRSSPGPWRRAIEGAAPFGARPSRRTAVIGIASAAGGGLLALLVATHALLPGEAVQGHAWRVAVSHLLGGVQRLDEQLFLLLNSLGSERWDGLW